MQRSCLPLTPFVLLTTLLATCTLLGMRLADTPGQRMQVFAASLLSTLSDEQISQVTLPYDSAERTDWHYVPKVTRKGLPLGELNTAQRTAVLRLLRSALSEAGYRKASQIMLLEGVLRQLEGPGSESRRNPENYFLTLFGSPSTSEPWGLSFEGHHLSLNFSCRDGRLVDSSPQLFAANPATIMREPDGPLSKGTRVLSLEEDLAFELLNSLDESQKSTAIIASDAPADIRFAGHPQAAVGEPDGIPFGRLNKAQADLLQELVSIYVGAVPEQTAKSRREVIDASGWQNVFFAWAGATKPGIGHYYRIQSKEFLIEFVNTQPDAAGNPANHIHCVWRDLTGDFDLPNPLYRAGADGLLE